ncbi:Interleukin-2 [Fukomys damarensis]|uniref:Interleukin-2 n=1 Tax=Fukomys damarensis TaxID=885580 RepID=A0A091E2M5_FUKDA|nr:Interleukin-2 [Fukomys damarensis]
MYKTLLLSCIALTLALITSSAPTSSSTRETQEQLEQLLLDLQVIWDGVTRNPKISKMLKPKLYFPNKPSELRHLQCLEEELKPLEQVLNLAEHKHFPLINTKDFISNINVTVKKLKIEITYQQSAALLVAQWLWCHWMAPDNDATDGCCFLLQLATIVH